MYVRIAYVQWLDGGYSVRRPAVPICRGLTFEYSESHYAGAHPLGAAGRLGDHVRQMLLAFLLFLAAGISDAVDGFLAKRFGMATELGAYLDPLADKALIVSIYVSLGIAEAIPRWLVILVVSRDFMIVGAFMLSWLIDRPVTVRPHPVSKLNTVVADRVRLPGAGSLGYRFDAGSVLPTGDGACRGLDLAFHRLLCRRMGAAYGSDGAGRSEARSVRHGQCQAWRSGRGSVTLKRQLIFWVRRSSS